MKTIVKLYDLGHSLKKLPIHIKWFERIVEEFFIQGQEKKLACQFRHLWIENILTHQKSSWFFEFIVCHFGKHRHFG